jgi:UDP-N-acetylenolpyruvoylglucosamine reductase
LGEFPLDRLQGEKNVSNATAVIALLHQLGFGATEIAAAIRPFRGAARRQQRLYQGPEGIVIDDYGHHPREIVATLQALKPANGRRLLVAFQPHRYTRTQHLMREFSGCFHLADRLWLAEIYAASEKPIPGVTGLALAEAIRAQGQAVDYVPEIDRLAAAVKAALEPGDTILFLGAGDITHAARILAAGLRASRAAATSRVYAGLTRLLTPGTVLRRDEPMAKHTTFRVGGPAEFYVEPVSEGDLRKLLAFCSQQQVPCRIVGWGSNLLVRDGGIRGVVVCLAAHFGRIDIQGRQVRCGAGARLREVVMAAKNLELGGLEFLEGIPGSVGGAMRMNAGAMGRQFYQVVERVRYLDMDGTVHECPASALPVAYRNCPLFRDHIALEAVLTGIPTPKHEIEAKLTESNHQRWTSQPAAPSAGCVFKNPPGASAGKLIDELGLKKMRAGGALISPVHANFIVNDGHATARDVLDLIEKVRGIVRSRAGLELELEVEIVGEEPDL